MSSLRQSPDHAHGGIFAAAKDVKIHEPPGSADGQLLDLRLHHVQFTGRKIRYGIVHGDCEEDAVKLAELVKAELGAVSIMIEPVGPSIGAHSGPGALGVIFLGETR